MKIKFLFLLIFSFNTLNVFSQKAKEVELKSSIKDVTVFLQNAQITRKGSVSISQGKSTLVFKSLSPNIDARSIQVKATGDFTILSVNHRFNYLNELKKDSEIDSLTNLLNKVEKKIDERASRVEVLGEKKSLLNANKDLGGQNSGATLTQLKQAIDFYDRELSSIKKEELAIQEDIEKLRDEKLKLQKQINDVRGTRNLPSGEVVVRVDAPVKVAGNFTITYLVSNAGWFPKYDVRVKDIDSPIKLSYKANVYQNTGVDWKNVKLKFSNGNPNQSGVAPELNTWYLSYVQNLSYQNKLYEMRAPKPEAISRQLEGQAAGVQAQDYSRAKKASRSVQTTTIENQTTVEFEVKTPYSIKSNGEKLTVDLSLYELEANYQYYAAPKLDKDAFLIARIINWDQYNLLEGEANLYFEDAYVGRSVLDAKSLSDTLDISLGRDKSIVIGREKVDEFSKRRTVGANKVETRGFKLLVRNKKSQSIKLTLHDQIPVSTISDIAVTPDELSGGKLDGQTGEITWELELKANEQKELILRYEVKYPKRERVILE